jgi:hypothetical protein
MAQVKAPKNKVVNMGVNPDKKKIPIRIGGITSEPAVPVDIEMHGRVVNESGVPVPFATVTITHPVKMIAADSAGRYSFITNDLEKFEWSVSSAGYEAVPAAKLDVQLIKSMDVSNNKVSTELKDVVLKQHTLKEAVVTAYGTTTRCIVSGGISAGVRVRRIDKVKIAVNKLAGRSDIKTYPNPAPAGGSFTVQFNVKDAGEYSVQFIDASGRIVAGRQLQIAAPGQTETFAAAALPGHGMYFIRVAGKKDGKVYNSKVEVL